MRQTTEGRVTPEMLDELERWATAKKKPHSLGVGNYVLRALVAEVREYRNLHEKVNLEDDYWGHVLKARYWITPEGEAALTKAEQKEGVG